MRDVVRKAIPMRGGRIGQAVLALGCVMAMMMAFYSAPALAHDTRVYEGYDFASIVGNHKLAYVCDQETDAHGVYGEFWLVGGGYVTFWDENGSQAPCGSLYLGAPAWYMRVCEGIPNATDPCNEQYT